MHGESGGGLPAAVDCGGARKGEEEAKACGFGRGEKGKQVRFEVGRGEDGREVQETKGRRPRWTGQRPPACATARAPNGRAQRRGRRGGGG
jgi:hypothetical protein